jgi:hypothetical protein
VKGVKAEGLWLQGGNLVLARFHSLHLPLQIKARLENLPVKICSPVSRPIHRGFQLLEGVLAGRCVHAREHVRNSRVSAQPRAFASNPVPRLAL